MQVQPLGQEEPVEGGMDTHSSVLAWRIPQTEEPGGATVRGVAKSRTQLSTDTEQNPVGGNMMVPILKMKIQRHRDNLSFVQFRKLPFFRSKLVQNGNSTWDNQLHGSSCFRHIMVYSAISPSIRITPQPCFLLLQIL